MGTYAFKISRGAGDFLCHSQSAVTVAASAILSYKFAPATESITGVLLGSRPRMGEYMSRLAAVPSFLGNPALPLLALAHYSLTTSKPANEANEHFYYIQKDLFTDSKPGNRRMVLEFRNKIVQALNTVESVLELQSNATQGLIRAIQLDFQTHNTKAMDYNLRMIDSLNNGLQFAYRRLDRAAQFSYAGQMEDLQIQIAEEGRKNVEAQTFILQARQETLTILRQLAEGRNNMNDSILGKESTQAKRLVTRTWTWSGIRICNFISQCIHFHSIHIQDHKQAFTTVVESLELSLSKSCRFIHAQLIFLAC